MDKTFLELVLFVAVGILILAVIGMINTGAEWYDRQVAQQTIEARRADADGRDALRVHVPHCPAGRRAYLRWNGGEKVAFCR